MPGRKSKKKSSGGPLRKRAEAMLRKSRTDIQKMSSADVQELVYELQIHQIELELQNEALREAQVELVESRDRLSDLYEFAPVGYVTIDQNGKILECNLTAATMLG
ncbi:MAG TPA: PAS domain-containing protein, partial [Terriglobia bacterium]|nr:PAS domain-containing protein [Terriglobia bacterium]